MQKKDTFGTINTLYYDRELFFNDKIKKEN